MSVMVVGFGGSDEDAGLAAIGRLREGGCTSCAAVWIERIKQ